MPTAAEVEEHEVTHYPYRIWCRFCVAAMGRRDQHVRGQGSMLDDSVALIAVDYAYLTDAAWSHGEVRPGTGTKTVTGFKQHRRPAYTVTRLKLQKRPTPNQSRRRR